MGLCAESTGGPWASFFIIQLMLLRLGLSVNAEQVWHQASPGSPPVSLPLITMVTVQPCLAFPLGAGPCVACATNAPAQ